MTLPVDPQDVNAYEYVEGVGNALMGTAVRHALTCSLDLKQKVACLLVDITGNPVGIGANGSDYHEQHGCERQRRGCKSGEGYELCEGCSPANHAEAKAIANAVTRGNTMMLPGATAYIWGHWWACSTCIERLREYGVERIVLLKDARKWFDATSPHFVFRMR